MTVNALGERFAVDVRHHEIHKVAGLGDGVDRNDVRMRQLGGEARLAEKALADGGVRRPLRRQDLDGDEPIEVHLAREEDDAHAAASELARERVAPGERQLELEKERVGGGVGHVTVFTRGPRRASAWVAAWAAVRAGRSARRAGPPWPACERAD